MTSVIAIFVMVMMMCCFDLIVPVSVAMIAMGNPNSLRMSKVFLSWGFVNSNGTLRAKRLVIMKAIVQRDV